MKYKYADAAIVAWALAPMLYLLTMMAFAGIVDDFQGGYRHGTLFPNDRDYRRLYERSTDRSIVLTNVKEYDDRVTAFYTAKLTWDGVPRTHTGVVMIYHKDGKLRREEHAPVEPAVMDLALAGQLADVGTTALALASGLSEGNPLVSGLIGSPVGAAAYIGLKVALVNETNRLGLTDCINARTAVGTIGWGFAGWNIGMLVHPVVAVIGAVVAGHLSSGGIEKDAPIRCISS
jgi:hypothetical protein